jgi:DNA-binding Xre family transcriptional regulator
MKTSKNNINTGVLLTDFIEKRFVNRTELATKINRTAQSITKYSQNSSIQTNILIEICHALEHNFFQDIANQLPENFTINPQWNSAYTQRLKDLEKENEVLKIQNELLMKLKG